MSFTTRHETEIDEMKGIFCTSKFNLHSRLFVRITQARCHFERRRRASARARVSDGDLPGRSRVTHRYDERDAVEVGAGRR